MEKIDTKIRQKVNRIRRIMENRIPLLLEDDKLEFASILKDQGESLDLYDKEVVNYNATHSKNKMLFILICKAPDLTIEITITKFKTYINFQYGIISYDTSTRDSSISAFELFLISTILRFRKIVIHTHSQTISAGNKPTQKCNHWLVIAG